MNQTLVFVVFCGWRKACWAISTELLNNWTSACVFRDGPIKLIFQSILVPFSNFIVKPNTPDFEFIQCFFTLGFIQCVRFILHLSYIVDVIIGEQWNLFFLQNIHNNRHNIHFVFCNIQLMVWRTSHLAPDLKPDHSVSVGSRTTLRNSFLSVYFCQLGLIKCTNIDRKATDM